MKNSFLQKKVTFLCNKLRSLREELQISKEIMHIAGAEVERLYRESRGITQPVPKEEESLAVSNDSSDTTKQKEDQIAEEEVPQPSAPVKKIFRKIALEIHPDKLPSS